MADFKLRATLDAEDKASPTIRAVGGAVDALRKKLLEASNASDINATSMKRLVSSLTSAEKNLNSLKDTSEKDTNATKNIAKGFVAAELAMKAFDATIRTIGSTLETGIKFEQFKTSFQTMTGSIQQGNLLLKNLYDFAATTPLELTTVVDGAKRLMAMGVQATDVENRLKTLGDIASVIGTEKLSNLILAFGQVNTATKLTGMELRQFTEAGVPLLEELSKITGVSTAKIKEDMAKGIIVPAALVNQALENMTKEGGIAFNAMDRQSKTLGGSITRLKNQWTLLSAKVGEFASTALVPVIDKVIDFMRNNSQMIISLGIATAAVLTFAGVVFSVISVMGRMAATAAVLKVSTLALAAPLILIATLIGVVAYKAMQNFQDKTKTAMDNVLKNFGNIGKSAEEELGKKAAKAAQDLAEKLADIDEQIAKSNRTFTENLAELVKSTKDKVKELTQGVEEETASFNKENDKRLKDFTKTQDELTKKHNEKVSEIQKQIDEEAEYGWLADQDKLADLKKELSSENEEYDSQFSENKAKYEEDTSEAKDQHEKKLGDLNTSLNEQLALLQKHSDDVLAVKDFQYRDEFQKLQDAHIEELAAFERQKEDAVKAAKDQSDESYQAQIASGNEYKPLLDQLATDLGGSMGQKLKDSFKEALQEMPVWVDVLFGVMATLVLANGIAKLILGVQSIKTAAVASAAGSSTAMSGFGATLLALPWAVVVIEAIAAFAAIGIELHGLQTDLINFQNSMGAGYDQITAMSKKADEFAAKGMNDKADRLRASAKDAAADFEKIQDNFDKNNTVWSNFTDGLSAFWKSITKKSDGGVVYAAQGFAPQGTDTVPAMLTPGEMVINSSQQKRLWDVANGNGKSGVTISNINIYGNINNKDGLSPEEIGSTIGRQIQLSRQGAY
jgi:tape measure domain-containing protein